MQTPYEVVYNAIHFSKPDRIPVKFDIIGQSDVKHVNWNQIGTGDNSLKESYDEWNCKWERTDVKNMGQVTGHPLYDWDFLSSRSFPDPNNPEFYTRMEERFQGCDNYYVTTSIFMLLFERFYALRGFENALMDLHLEREKSEALLDRIVEFDLGIIKNISEKFPGKIHGFTFTDDWGTEQNTFISVALWQQIFKPRYKQIFDACHEAGWDVWMHSCGKINNFLPDLIEIDVDVLNMQQPRTNGIQEIGKMCAGKVCFELVCDIQHTLPFESDEYIRQEARELIETWGTDEGGIIASDYGDGLAIGVDEKKKQVMFDAFLAYDRWKNNFEYYKIPATFLQAEQVD